jgi:hypothetical protein
MLVTAKVFMDHVTEGRPIHRSETVLHGLQPALGRAGEMHSSNTNPHGCLDGIHLKIVGGTSDPELCVVAIKLRKVHLR